MLFWEIVFVPKTMRGFGSQTDLDLNSAFLISIILASDLTFPGLNFITKAFWSGRDA